eukprot:TRINITY_DN66418_c1_g1_i1.p2 TRINITY_DN66418_c1_g1~~TRINITY_DN66418_c1_g1_i1.p2  ORF type:complete len:739 (+),score=500.05 TRINITY_DN66418_c1_g1_i1:153-2369(+)
MVQYNFKELPVVPTASEFVDIILSRTQRKTPTVVRHGWKISRIKNFYMRKVKFTAANFHEKLTHILDTFPKLDELHPFYADLINVLYSRDHYKLALGQLNKARALIDNLGKDYVRLLTHGDSLYRCKMLKRAALGRMCTVTKKLKASLAYLEEVRKHMSRLPSIDASTRTLMITGYPNVGKSSFINKISQANVDVQPYAFTTKSLFVGHFDYKYLRWQVIDTPGILDHPLADRNTIEMQAVTALAHLHSTVLFFIDISEACGYTIKQQVALYHSIKPLFVNKPLLVVANKTDLRRPEELDEEDRQLLASIKNDRETSILPMSNVSEEGIYDVKTRACDILLEHRVNRKLKGKRINDVMNRIHIAQPQKRDNKSRPVQVPPSVLRRRMQESQVKQQILGREDLRAGLQAAVSAATTSAGGSSNLPRTAAQIAAANKLSLLNDPEAADKAAAEAAASLVRPKKRTEKDIEAEEGGAGIYNFDRRKLYDLKEEDWRYDKVPHIVDGKNVADFFDPDIEQRLRELDAEEARLEQMAELAEQNAEDDPNDLDDETLALHDAINSAKDKIKLQAAARKANNRPRVPRKAWRRNIDDMEAHLNELGLDAAAVRSRSVAASAAASRGMTAAARDKVRRNAKRKREDSTSSSSMDTSGDGYGDDDSNAARRKMGGRGLKARGVVTPRNRQGVSEAQLKAAAKLQKKSLSKSNQEARAGAADRRVWNSKASMKHLLTGKRGIGSNDRR